MFIHCNLKLQFNGLKKKKSETQRITEVENLMPEVALTPEQPKLQMSPK